MTECYDRIQGYLTHFSRIVSKKDHPATSLWSLGPCPHVLVLTCVDPRIDVSALFGMTSGTAKVTRVVGACVPTWDERDGMCLHLNAWLYAGMILGVRDIIVMGHSDCLGLKCWGSHEHQTVHKWMNRALGSPKVSDEESVQCSVRHLKQYDVVRGKGRDMRIHGWFLHMQEGALKIVCDGF